MDVGIPEMRTVCLLSGLHRAVVPDLSLLQNCATQLPHFGSLDSLFAFTLQASRARVHLQPNTTHISSVQSSAELSRLPQRKRNNPGKQTGQFKSSLVCDLKS